MDPLLLALVAALVSVGARFALKRVRASRARKAPGRTVHNPLPVRTFREAEEAWTRARCTCGGSYRQAGESTTGTRHVVHVTCSRCEAEATWFFDLSGLLH